MNARRALAAFAWLLAAPLDAQEPATPKVDLAAMEAVEELSESLAHDLLDLSVATRQRDLPRTAGYLAADFRAAPFPSQPLPDRPQLKWLSTHGWAPETGGAAVADKDAFLRGWGRCLEHFSEIEDARFEVTQARFEDEAAGAAVGRARVSFFLVGRDPGRRREWVRGQAELVARRSGPRWQITSFGLESFDSTVAAKDLFSEVSLPAGLAVPRPVLPPTGRIQASMGWIWRGAAAADFDNDGFVDLLVASPYGNHLYRNDGQGRFRDASDETGVSLLASGTQPLALDYDNDGDEDVFLSAVGTQILLENRLIPEGRLSFRDVSAESGVAVQGMGFGAVAGDVNGDGRPDIYVACYNDPRVAPNAWAAATNGTPNLLFVNQGHGSFREEAAKWSIDDHRWSYAAEMLDMDGDGRLDVYVANDYGENGLYMNKGDHFVDEARERGVLDPAFGMGVSFADYDNDGILDLHVTDMSSTAGLRILDRIYPTGDARGDRLKRLARGDSLFKGLGGGRYRDVTSEAGPFRAGWAWGGGFLDFDDDGWQDLYVPNGYLSGPSMKDTESQFWRQIVTETEGPKASDPMSQRLGLGARLTREGFSFNGYERDGLYLNLGTGKFLDVSGASGIDSITDGRGAVFADFDNDGDLDVFLTTRSGPAQLLYRNNVGQDGHFLRVALEGGPKLGRDAYGSVVRLATSAGTLTQVKSGGSGFLSQNDPRLLFGLGRDARAQGLEVTWTDGTRERFAGDLKAGASFLLRQGTGRVQPVVVRAAALPDPASRGEKAARALKVAVGKPVPTFMVKTAAGAGVPLRQLLQPGRRTLLNVWASWCEPCSRQIPELERLRLRLAETGVDLLGLNLDLEPGADPAGFLRDHGAGYPSVAGGVWALEALYSTDDATVPLSLLLDENGVVLEVLPGFSDVTRRRLAVLAGEPQP